MSAAGESTNGQGPPLRLLFDAGTLVVEGPGAAEDPHLPGVKFDFRTRQFRAEAIWYRTIVEHVRQTQAGLLRTTRVRIEPRRGGSRSPRRRFRIRSRA